MQDLALLGEVESASVVTRKGSGGTRGAEGLPHGEAGDQWV